MPYLRQSEMGALDSLYMDSLAVHAEPEDRDRRAQRS